MKKLAVGLFMLLINPSPFAYRLSPFATRPTIIHNSKLLKHSPLIINTFILN